MDIQTWIEIGTKLFLGFWTIVAMSGFLKGIIKYIKLKPRIKFTYEGDEEYI